MCTLPEKYFDAIARFLSVPLGKISTTDLSLPCRTFKSTPTHGALNIIFTLQRESKSNLKAVDAVTETQIRQWLEFIVTYLININKQNFKNVLKKLNEVLGTVTYVVGHKLTIADVLLYYVLLDTMQNLPNTDKENYLNVSRWFDNLQQDPSVRRSNNSAKSKKT